MTFQCLVSAQLYKPAIHILNRSFRVSHQNGYRRLFNRFLEFSELLFRS